MRSLSTSGREQKVIERADAEPGFDAGWGVAARVPPPSALLMGAAMVALNFAQLQRVNEQADIAVAGEPGAVVLVTSFYCRTRRHW